MWAGFVKLDVARAQRVELGVIGGGSSICPQSGAPELRARVTYKDESTVDALFATELEEGWTVVR